MYTFLRSVYLEINMNAQNFLKFSAFYYDRLLI